MHVRNPPPPRQQRPHIATRLRAVQLAERPPHVRDLQVLIDVGSDHEKEAAGWSAFVQLPGRVEIPRADTERGRTPQGATPGGAQLLELANYVGGGRDIREDGEIVARPDLLPELRQGQRREGRSILRPDTPMLR